MVVEDGNQHGETLIADLCVLGVWLPQAEVLLDIRVVDTDTQSYLHHTPGRVLLMLKLKRRTSILMPVLHDVPTLRPNFFCRCLSRILGHLLFEEDGMQIEYSVGQELC